MKTVSHLMIVWLLTTLVMPSAASDRLPAIEDQPSEHGANPEVSDPDRWKWIDQSDMPGVIHDVYFSEASQRRIGYNVFLPGSYEVQLQRRYPVVFYLHGRGGTENNRLITRLLSTAQTQTRYSDAIWVIPNGGQYSRYQDSIPGSVMSETWITEELVEHIDSTYRTIPTREGRALVGYSMGGRAALLWLARHQDKYCCAVALSPALSKNLSGELVSGYGSAAERLSQQSAMLISIGEQDFLLPNVREFEALLVQLAIPYDLKTLPDIGHHFGEVLKYAREDILRFLEESLHTLSAQSVEDKSGSGSQHRVKTRSSPIDKRCLENWPAMIP